MTRTHTRTAPAPIDVPQLRQLSREGLSASQIVDRLESLTGHRYSVTAVIRRQRGAGIPRTTVQHARAIPWRLRPEHMWTHWARMLRAASREGAGRPLTKTDARALTAFRKMLDDHDAVVYYDRDTTRGWWLLPRRAGVDLGLIREPTDGVPNGRRYFLPEE